MRIITHVSIIATAILIAGCAAPTAPIQTSASATAASTEQAKVPSLKVVTNCGKCEVDPRIPILINESYAAAAEKAGMSIDGQSVATLTITQFSKRMVLIRLLGPLSTLMPDAIQATLEINGRSVTIDENVRLPLRGMDAVANKVGEASFESLKEQISTTKEKPQ